MKYNFSNNLFIIGYKVLNHDKYLQQLLKSQWYSKNEIHKLINDEFMNIFQYAFKNVPYYKKLLSNGEIDITKVNSATDITKLPIINKEQIRNNPEEFISNQFKKHELIVINTSGTTGKTLKIYVDKNSRRYSYAFFSRLKKWAGVDGSHKNITFAGRTIVSPDSNTPPFWRVNYAWNNYLFSSYHLSNENMKYYVNEMKNIKPYYIDSYPSSIYAIAKYMQENNISGIQPKAIITSSETLFDSQREVIEKVFSCPVFDQYGSAEQVVFISQCEEGNYHVHPEYGIVEFLREDGSTAEPGENARLICTGFTNKAMPLIRYDIGDTGILSNKKCSCGRNYPVIEKIVGRTDDILVTKEGRQVGRLDPVFKGLQTIKEAQIIQEDYDNFILKIVPGVGYKNSDIQNIIWELKKRLGEDSQIIVEKVVEIPRSANGKFRAVISKVK